MLRRRLTESPPAPSGARGAARRSPEPASRRSPSGTRGSTSTLREARDQIVALKEEVDRLAQPPSGYGVFLQRLRRRHRRRLHRRPQAAGGGLARRSSLDGLRHRPGGHAQRGAQRRARPASSSGPATSSCSRRCSRAATARSSSATPTRSGSCYLADILLTEPLRAGDSLLLEPRSGYVYERIPKSEVEELVLEEVPDIDYADIGGLARRSSRSATRSSCRSCTPTCSGSTSCARRRASCSTARPAAARRSSPRPWPTRWPRRWPRSRGKDATGRSYFLNIKGPELLNKYVGETERHIRLVFQRAREKASEGTPVIVFFDEMDSIFRTRGSGVSSDVENTIVPQLLSEIDGVEGLENVIVIGASNREDMIDPAILRPGPARREDQDRAPGRRGRAGHLLQVRHHDAAASTPTTSPSTAATGEATVAAMIQRTVERMYTESEDNRFLEVTYANGDKEVLYFKDFNSGAMIQNIVDRAKKMAIKDFLETGPKGLRLQHLMTACVDEFRENEDLPNTTNPDDWARISGKKGERIVYIRTLVSGKGHRGRSGDRHGLQHRPVPVVALRRRRPLARIGAARAPWEKRHRRRRLRGSAPSSSVASDGRRRDPAGPRRIGVPPSSGGWASGGHGRSRGPGAAVGVRSAPAGAVRHVRESLRWSAPARYGGRRRRRARRKVPGVNRVLLAAATATGRARGGRLRRRSDPRPRRGGGGRRHAERPAHAVQGRLGRRRPRGGTAVSGQAADRGAGHDNPLAGVDQGQQGRRLPLPDPGERHRLQPRGHRHRCDQERRRLGVRPGPGPAERLVVGLGRAACGTGETAGDRSPAARSWTRASARSARRPPCTRTGRSAAGTRTSTSTRG